MAEYKQLKYTFDEINRGLAAATVVGDLAPSRANALKNQVSNEIIQIDDCAPLEHEMSIKVRGKNLIDMSAVSIPSGQSYSYENGIATISQGTYVYVPRARWDFFDVSMFEGKTLTVSLDITEDQGTNTKGNILYIQGISNKEYSLKTLGFTQTGKITLTYTFADKLDYDKIRIMLYAQHLTDASESLSFTNVQFEMGSTATAYAPYIEDISTVKVKKYSSKNLADIYGFSASTLRRPTSIRDLTNPDYGITISTTDPSDSIEITVTQNTGTASATNYRNGYFFIGLYNKFQGSDTVTVSFDLEIKNNPLNATTMGAMLNSGDIRTFNVANGRCSVTLNGRDSSEMQAVEIRVNGCSCVMSNIQLEIGTSATAYEPYIEPTEYDVDPDGIVDGITSQISVMTLMGDTPGAILDVEYNQDVNKWRDKISTAAIMLGGL